MDAFEGFKWTTVEEASTAMWIAEPFLDTLNWFPDESEEARVALASRALRELHSEGLIVLRDATTKTKLPDDEIDALLSGDEWHRVRHPWSTS